MALLIALFLALDLAFLWILFRFSQALVLRLSSVACYTYVVLVNLAHVNMKPKRKSIRKSHNTSKAPDKLNPFEVKVNKQRHDVLGRKSKNDRGLPGVSRNKAIKKRKETLLQEYVLRNKSSAFMDNRIGEFDASMDADDKMAARLARERKVSHKKSVFSLNEEEELTHLGKSIDDTVARDDPRSDDEDLYDKLGKDFADKTNFGGFLTKADPNSDATKSRREAIDQLIAESKKLKYERQVQKDENVELTEKLDSDWKVYQGLLAASRLKKKTDEHIQDDYDVLVKELRFEPRAGVASDRVKTENELAKEERKRLEELEQERQRRAKGAVERKAVRYFMSADDLDDGFYKQEPVTEHNEADTDDEEGTGAADECDSEDAEEGNAEEDVDSGRESPGQDKEESEDSYSDLNSEDDADVANQDEPAKPATENSLHGNKVDKKCKVSSDTCADVPESEEEFSKLLANKTDEEKACIIDNMIKGNQNTKKNRKSLESLFVFLLQHLNDVADSNFHLVDKLCPHIYSLVQLSPVACAGFLLDVISEKEEELQKEKKSRFSISFPSFSTLVFLKIVGQCYSVSDFSHLVGTPAMLFASHLLSCCGLNKAVDFLRGTFVANVFLEYVAYSKRFSPETLAFLTRLISHANMQLRGDSSVKDMKDLKLSLKLLGSENFEMTNQLRVRLTYAAMKVIEKCVMLWGTLPSFRELADPLVSACHKLSISSYPEEVQQLVQQVAAQLAQTRERKPLRPDKKPPPMKKLLEPRFSMKFDGRKHVAGAEFKKLKYRHKKEMKGAMREIRRDNQFLAQHILKERMEKDAQRQEKVKQIYRELASQEGEYKALKRKK